MGKRIADTIVEALEQMIVTGEFADGERLDEVKLAARFSVSRTPLREALQTLAASGLVTLEARRGAFVRHPEFVELIEMFEVMAELEAMCARLAARRAGAVALGELRQAAEACEQARSKGDTNEYYWENERFHLLIYKGSGNSFLAAEARRLHKRLQPYRRMQLTVRGRMADSMKEHREILQALEAGSPDKASEAVREHIAIQGEKFNDLMASYNSSNQALRVG